MRYITGILIAIGLVVLTIVLIIKAFGGGGGPEQKRIDLTSYASTDAVMQLTIDGPLNADEEHRQLKITVGRDETTLDVLQGYDGQVIRSQSYQSNQVAYVNFLRALEVNGFINGDANPNFKDERGQCATGQRYIFEAVSGGEDVLRWWATSCGGGNFKGDRNVVRTLFRNQIPDFSKLAQGTGLY